LGDAGAVLVNDKELYHKIYQLHDHGRDTDGEVKRWGRNSRLDNIQAAILSHKFKSYDRVIDRRRTVAQIYQDRLGDLTELQLPPAPSVNSKNFDVYQNYELQADKRDLLKAHLYENGVGTLIQWGGSAIHQFKNLGFTQECPNTDKFFERCIMLPMNIFISDDEIHYACDKVIELYRENL
jgi:dTDP-4-amino-4,6-dideoxygalactose transaminase